MCLWRNGHEVPFHLSPPAYTPKRLCDGLSTPRIMKERLPVHGKTALAIQGARIVEWA